VLADQQRYEKAQSEIDQFYADVAFYCKHAPDQADKFEAMKDETKLV